MSGALVLFLTFAGIGVVLAVLLVLVPWRSAAVVVLVVFLGVGSCAFAVTDSQDRTTLLETVLPVPPGTLPAVVELTVPVTHPGAEHELRVEPLADRTEVATVTLRAVLTAPDGQVVHDEREAQRYGCTRGDCDFTVLSAAVRPALPGPHVLTVAVEGPGVGELRVAVFDEQETGGERAPGY